MTIEATGKATPRFGRRGLAAGDGALPIGEADANIFECPGCARPLATGASRCPGCGTRLLAGVKLVKVTGFVGLGLALGLGLGGGGMALSAALAPTVATPIVDAPPAVTPSQAPVASVAPPAVDPSIPAAAVSALRQSAEVNQRILVDAALLSAALQGDAPTGKSIAPILRSLAATAAFGDRLSPAIGTWDEGAALSQSLVTFYAAIGGAADDGLAAAMSNGRAYEEAGKRMMQIVGGIGEIDAASRVLAAEADLELPPLGPTP